MSTPTPLNTATAITIATTTDTAADLEKHSQDSRVALPIKPTQQPNNPPLLYSKDKNLNPKKLLPPSPSIDLDDDTEPYTYKSPPHEIRRGKGVYFLSDSGSLPNIHYDHSEPLTLTHEGHKYYLAGYNVLQKNPNGSKFESSSVKFVSIR